MPQQVTIRINKTDVTRRFMQSTWKQGRTTDLPNVVKQTYNVQADNEESADAGLMEASFNRWIWAGIDIMREYLADTPTYAPKPHDDEFVITLLMPNNWEIHSLPALKYALAELIHNGMLADWYDDTKPDAAKAHKQKAEVNKAEIHSNIYALNPPNH